MRKLLSLLLCAALCLSLAACGGATDISDIIPPGVPDASSPHHPEQSDEELAAEVDAFLTANDAFLSHSWSYLTAGEIDGGGIAKLRPHCLIDIADAAFDSGVNLGYEEYGYVNHIIFLNDAERSAVDEIARQYAPLFINFVCSTHELQLAFDRFYGPDRIDVTTWTGDGSDELLVHARPQWEVDGEEQWIYTTILLTLGLGGGSSGTLIERDNIARDGDKIAVTCRAITWYEDLGSGVVVYCMNAGETTLASSLDWSVLNYTSNVGSSEVYRPGDFSGFINAAGISRDSIEPIRLILFRGSDGALHLWGVDRSGAGVSQASASTNETSPASSQNEAPDGVKPQVTPNALSPEVMKTVSANGGLRMRQGPGRDYDYIQMIPDASRVPTYAEQNGWYYVFYSGRYGWASGDYLL